MMDETTFGITLLVLVISLFGALAYKLARDKVEEDEFYLFMQLFIDRKLGVEYQQEWLDNWETKL